MRDGITTAAMADSTSRGLSEMRIPALVVLACLLVGCGGEGEPQSTVPATTTEAAAAPTATQAETTAEEASTEAATSVEDEPTVEEPVSTEEELILAMSSLCGEYTEASAADQRAFAESYRGADESITDAIDRFTTACTAKRKALQINEALDQVALAESEAELDKILSQAEAEVERLGTHIDGRFAAEIAREIKKSWNRCNENDVCIPGEPGLAVGCAQPDKQVSKLRCFVTTERTADEQYGYTVAVDVNMDTGSYTWRLAQND